MNQSVRSSMNRVTAGAAKTTGKPYEELGAGYFTRRLDPERVTPPSDRRLEALGRRVTLEDTAA